MFRGSSTHKLDTKGRISIPSRFRAVMDSQSSAGLMLSRRDTNLVVYTYAGWEKVEQRILALEEKDDAMRRFISFFIGAADDCPLDSQGRVLVSPFLRSYAGLEKEIVLVGVLDHFEIHSAGQWEKKNQQVEDDLLNNPALRNALSKIGI